MPVVGADQSRSVSELGPTVRRCVSAQRPRRANKSTRKPIITPYAMTATAPVPTAAARS